ncbi:Plant UBX domain-containing protein 7 [Citrus sinensis]|uniref:Plant UBX domain-containing protein 7 n=1 Tax=Citrus sinensis TaxID=2711 RepID=A0ACB8IQG9_CITSI|nr:Plant UBX domain-containing protein 7 [Citrus sinensis]
MDSVLSANDKQSMVSSFLEIAVGQTAETAVQFLQATSWKLDEAIQLFYVGNESGAIASASRSPAEEIANPGPEENSVTAGQEIGDEVRAPLPVVRDTLYDDAMFYAGSGARYPLHEPSSLIAFRNFDEEMKRPGVWESEQGAASTADSSRDNLASLYRPPFHLMFNGSFEKAKDAASVQDKWLLVNLQSTKEFSSHMLNRDTWANEAVSQTISTNFIFWQVYDDTSEGKKVCTYYKLDSIPVVLVVDPITGQKMRSWCGMVQPESLLEDLVPFMDGGPREQHAKVSHKRPRGSSTTPQQKNKDKPDIENEELLQALAASMETIKDASGVSSSDTDVASTDKEETSATEKPAYPALPEEPKVDRSLLCRVGVRLPDGRRMQRNFLRTDPIQHKRSSAGLFYLTWKLTDYAYCVITLKNIIENLPADSFLLDFLVLQLLWSYCYSQLEGSEMKPFRLTHAIPGATKSLDYDSKLTFEDSGLANAMISVTWE